MADGDPDAPSSAPAPVPDGTPTKLPDDHPLVTAYGKLKEKLRAVEDADKSELQRAQDALAEKDAALADLPKQVRRQVLRFASTATAKGFLDPEDALAFMAGDVDLDDASAVDKALDDLAERKPHLVRKAKPASRPKPASGGQPDDEDPTAGLTGKERAAAALRSLRNT